MTHNIAKIRAALEMARDYITSDLASERGAFEGYEGVSRIGEIKADLANNDDALAALAELEKSAAEPVGEIERSPFGLIPAMYPDSGIKAGMKLYTNPLPAKPAPLGPALGLVEIREPTPEECERIDSVYASLDRTSHGRAMFNAVRNVMWPKEGL